MIDKIEVDGKVYDLKFETKNDEVTASYLETDGNWYQLSAKFTPGIADDLKSFNGLKGAEKELFDILLNDFRFEISKKHNGDFWSNYVT